MIKVSKNFLLGLGAVAGTALIIGAVISGKPAKTPVSVPTTAIPSNQAVVGSVASLFSGTLSIKDEKSGELRPLQTGDTLHLGDTIIAATSTKATLKLSKPAGMTNDPELVFIKPLPGEKYIVNIRLERQADGSVEATISS